MRGTRVSTIVLKFKRATSELGTVLDRRGRAAVLKYLSDRDHLSRLRNEIRGRYLVRGGGGGIKKEITAIYAEYACRRRPHFRKWIAGERNERFATLAAEELAMCVCVCVSFFCF